MNWHMSAGRVLAVVGLVLTSGCVSIITMGLPQSKYLPIVASESAARRYLDDVKEADGKIVTDSLGTYFHRSFDDHIEVFNITDLDKDSLKSMLSGDVGLLEPLVSYKASGQPFIDWPATERRHAFLSNELHLRLLPLAVSRQYYQQVQRFAASESARLSSTGNAVSAAFNGGYSLYSQHFHEGVLKPLGQDFQYLVKDSLFAAHFMEMKSGAIGIHDSMVFQIGNASKMDFVPRRYFETLQTVGAVRHFSGCGMIDSQRFLEGAKAGFGKPIGTGTTTQRYAAATASLDGLRRRAESSCVEGLRAMAIGGAIRSQTLR